MLALVRIVAANWSLGTQTIVAEPDRPYTFFSAKTAVAFVQLSNGLRKWTALVFLFGVAFPMIVVLVIFCQGAMLRTGRAENGGVKRGLVCGDARASGSSDPVECWEARAGTSQYATPSCL